MVQPFSGNILYGLSANTRTLVADNKTRLAVSNNNYFFNPYQNSHIYAEGAKTLAQWQAYSGLDATSKTHQTSPPLSPPTGEGIVLDIGTGDTA